MVSKREHRLKEIYISSVFAICIWIISLLRFFSIINYNECGYGEAINLFFKDSLPGFFYIEMYREDLPYFLAALGVFLAVVFVVALKSIFLTQDRPGEEEGSAKWNNNLPKFNQKFNAPFNSRLNTSFENTIIGQVLCLGLEWWKTDRNNNFLVIGGSGSGKTRFFIKPNVLQGNASFVITDPSAAVLNSCGKFLEEEAGYKLKVFNTVDMHYSNCYNPFRYINSEKDIIIMVSSLMKNTVDPKAKSEGFWDDTVTELLTAICYYLWKHCPIEKQNFSEVANMVRMAKVNEQNSGQKIPLDDYFDPLPDWDFGKMQYTNFRIGAGKTVASIVISTLARLKNFDLVDVKNLTDQDNLNLMEIGEERQALFVIMPPTDDNPFKFLVSMVFTQLFEGLYYKATYKAKYVLRGKKSNDSIKCFATEEEAKELLENLNHYKKCQLGNDKYAIKYLPKGKDVETSVESEYITFKEGAKAYIDNQERILNEGIKIARQKAVELPIYVRFLLDEFANIGAIPDFTNRLSTMRQYNISCCVILQNFAQLSKNYEKEESTFVAQCDTVVFLGSNDNIDKTATCEKISQLLGKQTIRTKSESSSKSAKGGSGSTSIQKKGRPLMTPDEVSNLDTSMCIAKIRAVDPFLVKKHNYISHPNYKYSSDADNQNFFNYMEREWKIDTPEESPEHVNNDPRDAQKMFGNIKEVTQEEFYRIFGYSSSNDITPEELENPLSYENEKKESEKSEQSVQSRVASPFEINTYL